jgi:hypothetical protein
MLDEELLLDTTTLEAALQVCGWKESSDGGFRRKAADGTAELIPLHDHSGWHRWRLRCRGIRQPDVTRHLHEQHALRGPLKLVAQNDQEVMVRVDAPLEWHAPAAATSAQTSPDSMSLHDPWHVWARAVTDGLCKSASDEPLPELPLGSYEQEPI